jgi:acyl-CoA synthetase (NDP forming)
LKITSPTSDAGLTVFSDPASVAVVGASENPAKWGHWLAAGALAGRHRRDVHLVNRGGGTVLGRPSARSLADLSVVPELVALCVPASGVDDVVDEALELGVRGFLGVTAGVDGEAELAGRIRRGGARLVGANSLGIFDASTELHLAWGEFTAGPLAVISQSGQLGSELAILGARHGVGISRFVSVGNQSDVRAAELLADLTGHEPTRVIALYLESFADGEALFRTLRALRASGKPTLLLTTGASAASARLARSHTGSMTAAVEVVEAACRAAGVRRVSTPTELIDIARTYLSSPIPTGRRIGVVGDSGGQGGVAADVAAAAGLTVPVLAEPLAATLASTLPTGAACTNPVDLAGAGEQDLTHYAAVVRRLLESDELDSVVLTGYFGCYGTDTPARAEREIEIARQLGLTVGSTGKPLVVHSMGPDTAAATALWQSGVPVFASIESALRALAGLAGLRSTERAAPPHTSTSGIAPSPNTAVQPGYWAARQLLMDNGVGFPEARLVHRSAELAEAGTHLRPPFALKAGWLEHKSEAGGVVVGIDDDAELLEVFEKMHHRLGHGDYVVEELDTRPDTVEILVGARRDPGLGPFVVVGAGGAAAEVHQDITIEMAPVSPATAATMLDRLRCAALLRGWRGRPAVDVDELAVLISTVSQLIAARTDIDEIELNPVRVGPSGALAVDALVIPHSPT